VSKSDITFAMLADPAAALAVATGYPEIAAVNGITAGKGYIDCSTVSVDCSQRIAAAVSAFSLWR
jgi:3-hydroxyisobutyrate dehydrogenase-like beta-hydroxyacid dehydrogenase